MLNIRYLATINYSLTDSYSKSFDSIKEAKDWLDSKNNNLEYTTKISEVDDGWRVVDWFYYTKGVS